WWITCANATLARLHGFDRRRPQRSPTHPPRHHAKTEPPPKEVLKTNRPPANQRAPADLQPVCPAHISQVVGELIAPLDRPRRKEDVAVEEAETCHVEFRPVGIIRQHGKAAVVPLNERLVDKGWDEVACATAKHV